jgi:hypothetical protein
VSVREERPTRVIILPSIWNVSLKTPQHLTNSKQTLHFEGNRFRRAKKKKQLKPIVVIVKPFLIV